MKKSILWVSSCLILHFFFAPYIGFGQNHKEPKQSGLKNYEIIHEVNLSYKLNETSGIQLIDTFLLSFNDSGNGPVIYALSPRSGDIFFQWEITNIENQDWEDISIDSNFIYIGDFGNNFGYRKDLTIYRINKDSLIQFSSPTCTAEILSFTFEDQETFFPSFYDHSFDCEALVCNNDSLFIFSKDWKRSITTMYRIPNVPGNHVAKKIDSFNVGCYVTGADYSSTTSILFLTGYSKKASVIWKFENASLANIFKGSATEYTLNSVGKIQNEGITIISENEIYLSSESMASHPKLYRIRLH